MALVKSIDVPEGSLLSEFGGPEDYRDCFVREVPGDVSLGDFIERFYGSMAFLPERLVLKALRTPASRADARALANWRTDKFGVWELVERREDEILLESKPTNTASWLSVEPIMGGTRLYFGSWVGSIGQSGWKSLEAAHVWYSRELLGSV